MSGAVVEAAQEREIGRYDGGTPELGPTLLVVAGVHGNEPAGVAAAERVLATLRERDLGLKGRLVALRGNLGALAAGRRFLGRDLNRGWSAASIEATRARPRDERAPEDDEQLALIDAFLEVERSAHGPLVFVDLHTSSATGSPFLCLADTIDNRKLGLMTGVPMILGIEESLAGASLEWFADRGIAALAVEGGQHESTAAIDNHEAVLWELMTQLGMLPPGFVELEPHRARLREAVGAAPPMVEITHRQAIEPGDGFRMEPGFDNFSPVTRGQLLATDDSGAHRAPSACFVMLPLYQELGEDGFFLARRVRRVWHWSARWLRAASLWRLLPLLPGISRDPADPDTLLADARVAKRFMVEVFHLLGFRNSERRGARLAFTRRRSRLENRTL